MAMVDRTGPMLLIELDVNYTEERFTHKIDNSVKFILSLYETL